MQITRGLFAGITPAEGEIRSLYDRSGQPVLRDGVPVQSFGVHQRTPYVLEKFSPLDGYCIDVVAEPGAFDLPDPDTLVPDGQGGQRMANQPTVKFTARLIDPNNRTLATASYLKVINSLSSHQEGETLARGRLYEALGLPGASGEIEVATPAQPRAAPKAATASAVAIGSGTAHLPAKAKEILATAEAEALVPADAKEVPASSDTSSPSAAAAPVSAVPAASQPIPAAAPAATTDPEPSDTALNGDKLQPALVRQAIARARSKGVTLPAQFDSAEHLRVTYRELCSTRKSTPTTTTEEE
ncbi:hypothetical protein [Rhodanobacter denitrificans]|uniref:hypothetical protein n=1 Tax=Rhodanobacter denitrificans TaxID=666685 RepID=UPI001F36EBED|nr:hypothetical protein [Rhodanobacter denitrificans]UJJ60429.1 hypothetical protein LRK55_18490 [Rhodanobacter denitrificans]